MINTKNTKENYKAFNDSLNSEVKESKADEITTHFKVEKPRYRTMISPDGYVIDVPDGDDNLPPWM